MESGNEARVSQGFLPKAAPCKPLYQRNVYADESDFTNIVQKSSRQVSHDDRVPYSIIVCIMPVFRTFPQSHLVSEESTVKSVRGRAS